MPRSPTPAPIARIPLRREPGLEVELRIDADERGIVLTHKEMRRHNLMDLPGVSMLVIPAASIADVIRALEAALAAAEGRG
jgi:hypothetical protein